MKCLTYFASVYFGCEKLFPTPSGVILFYLCACKRLGLTWSAMHV